MHDSMSGSENTPTTSGWAVAAATAAACEDPSGTCPRTRYVESAASSENVNGWESECIGEPAAVFTPGTCTGGKLGSSVSPATDASTWAVSEGSGEPPNAAE